MKYASIIGLVLLSVGLVLFIVQEPVYYTQKEFYIGAFLGLGFGLVLGGIMGFAQKKRKKVVQNIIKPAEHSSPQNNIEVTPEDNGVKF